MLCFKIKYKFDDIQKIVLKIDPQCIRLKRMTLKLKIMNEIFRIVNFLYE